MKNRKRALVATAAVIIVLTLALALQRGLTAWALSPHPQSVVADRMAPRFDWKTEDGVPGSLQSHSGRAGQVLLFVSSTCPCSNEYAYRFLSLFQRYRPQGFNFLFINEDKVRLLDFHPTEPLQKVLVKARAAGLPVEAIRDHHDAIARQYHVQVTPEAVLVDARGFIRYQGRIDDNQDQTLIKTHELQDALDDLLAGREVAVKQKHGIGCFVEDDGN